MNARQFMLGLLVLCALVGSARSQDIKLEPIWQRTHAPGGMALETRASTALSDGGLAVLGLQRPLSRGKDRSEDKAWIGLFGVNGDVRSERTFVMRAGDAAVQEVDAFAPLSSGDFVVAGQALGGDSWLLVVAPSGATRAIRPLGRSRIAVVLTLPDGDLVLGGRDGRDLYAARLRIDGGLVWERRLDRGFDDLFLSGVPLGEGVLMLELSGVREQFFMRDAVLGLTLLGDGRESIRSPSFSLPGRAGAFVASGNGYALIVDTAAGVKQNLRFVRLDSAFKATVEAEVLAVNFSLERARLARPAAGGYWVTALDGGKLVSVLLDEAGQVSGRIDSAAGHAYLHPDVSARESAFVVATELIEREGGGGVRTAVFVARLPARKG
jgi:hypothetical protein